MIRDSYAHCFSTFLASDYQNIYLVDLRYYRDNLSQFVAEHPGGPGALPLWGGQPGQRHQFRLAEISLRSGRARPLTGVGPLDQMLRIST